MEYYIAASQKFHADLSKIQFNVPYHKSQSAESIKLVSATLTDLCLEVKKNGFESEIDEIEFFKEIKPLIYAQLIFHTKILDVESKKLVMSADRLELYKSKIIKSFHYHFQDNLEFVEYYNSEHTHLDKHYFTRNFKQGPILNNGNVVSLDNESSVKYCYIAANILAFELITNHFYNDKIKLIQSNITWTDSKSDLIELIYALQQSSAVNNGNVDIKELCNVFEQAFNIKLNDPYKIFHDIRSRKGTRTKMLNKLTSDLDKFFDEFDE